MVLRLQIVGCDPSLRHVRSGIQHGNNRMVPLFLKPSLGQFSFETDVWEPPLWDMSLDIFGDVTLGELRLRLFAWYRRFCFVGWDCIL